MADLAFTDRAQCTTTTIGTGTLTLGSASTQFQLASLIDGRLYEYVILDVNGTGWETGIGTYTASGTTLSRGAIQSSNSNAAITISATGSTVILGPIARMADSFYNAAATPGNRLSLTTAVPVTTSNVTAAGTIYYTPYTHNRISLWNGSYWRNYACPEISLALTLTSGNAYDVFIYDNAGTLTLELSAAWTNDTTRADAIARQDGVQVKSSDHTRRLIGTIYATGTNTTEDSLTKRYIFNLYNQVVRPLYITDATASWTYTTATYRQKRGTATNQVEAVFGDLGALIDLTDVACITNSTGAQTVANGIGISSTTVNSAKAMGLNVEIASAGINQMIAKYNGYPGLGRFYFAELEWSTAVGTSTWYGTVSQIITGMTGSVLA